MITDILQWLVLPVGVLSIVLSLYTVFRYGGLHDRLGNALALAFGAGVAADFIHLLFAGWSAFDLWMYIPQWVTASLRLIAFIFLIVASVNLIKKSNKDR